MKFQQLYLSLFISLFGITILGFNIPSSQVGSCFKQQESWGTNTAFVKELVKGINDSKALKYEDLLFRISGNFGPGGIIRELSFIENEKSTINWNVVYGRSVTRNVIQSARKVDDLIKDYPSNLIQEYDAVWIKTKVDGKKFSAMSQNNKLSAEQLEILDLAELGINFEVVINYNKTDSESKIVKHNRLNIGLNVVPKQEAQFPTGYDGLMSYFRENEIAKFNGMTLKEFTWLRVRFVIDTDGKVDHIQKTNSSGYKEIDDHILQLVENMPNWIPARDSNGEEVSQEFELNLGTPGC